MAEIPSRIKPSTNFVKIVEFSKISPADSAESAKEFVLPLTYFDLAYLKFPPAECLHFFKLNDSSGLTPFLDRAVIHDSAGLETLYLDYWAATKIPGTEWNPRSLELLPTFALPENMLRATFHLSRDAINKLKESVMLYHQTTRSNSTEQIRLSTYVVVCAYVSVCLVKARGGDKGRKVYLIWSADCRSHLSPLVPHNYFGNCVIRNHLVEEAAIFMAENGVAIIAEKLSGSIKGLEKGLFNGAKERLVMLRGLPPEVQIFGLAGSTQMGLYELDFGWGGARKVNLISLARTGGFSIMETTKDGCEGIEIGLVLTKPEMESFASTFISGLKVSQSDQ